ncbi:MAG: DUF86 domain-containing protein [Anaerolineae bacterium]
MRNAVTHLHDLLQYIGDIEAMRLSNINAIQENRIMELALTRAYEVIGEIVKRLPDNLLATQPHVEWRKIKGFRDFLIHQYHRVDISFLWEAMQDLPNLKAAVEAMLRTLPPPETEERYE